MNPTLQRHAHASWAELSPVDSETLLDTALRLRQAAQSGRARALLRGKNLGLLCADDTQPQAILFRRAASQLGAHVSHVTLSRAAYGTSDELDQAARVLGRLYDAVECQDIDADLVGRIALNADIVVFDRLASPDHPTAALAARMDASSSALDNRCFMLQAVLLETMA